MNTITVTVTIDVSPTNKGIMVTVDPFVAVINLGDEIEWKLASGYTDASMTIEKKRGSDWPFKNDPPGGIKKGTSKKTGETKSGAKAKNRYNIVCTVVDGKTPTEFPIDPDIIIIGGAFES